MISPARGVLLMLVGTLAMAASAVIIAGIDSEPMSVAAWRCLLACPMLLPSSSGSCGAWTGPRPSPCAPWWER